MPHAPLHVHGDMRRGCGLGLIYVTTRTYVFIYRIWLEMYFGGLAVLRAINRQSTANVGEILSVNPLSAII